MEYGGKSVENNRETEWLQELERELNGAERQSDIKVQLSYGKYLTGNRLVMMDSKDIG